MKIPTVAKSSRRSDPIAAIGDCAKKLIEALCLAFSGSAAAQGYANHIEEAVSSANSKAMSARNVEKKVADKVKAVEEKLKDAEKRAYEAVDAQRKAENVRRKAENDLAAAQSSHSRYLQVAMHAALDETLQQAVEDYQQSNEFNRDMKAGFALTKPTVIGVDWLFVPEVFGEIAAEGERAPEAEEGEVTGGAREAEETLWAVLLGPSKCRVSVQHGDLSPWFEDHRSAGVGIFLRGPGAIGVQGLPKQTLSWVMLGYLLRSAWVFIGNDPGPTLVLDGMCPDFLLGYPGVKVAQTLDLSVRGVDIVHLEDGHLGDRFRSLAAHLVHRLHVALPGPFLISSKNPIQLMVGNFMAKW
ncbi:hypothetical protein TIFTF001_034375 [Ficus carica]|uniref:Uncharacterized protein n=1 Tax=Ficus carica TaxID=3494 RepID=A0AA88E0B5_FICCA|nr:hypothetical protein TIFTF001_034375 [Ficus carica]